jgi:hypothetical protein
MKFLIILAIIIYVMPRLIKWALKGFIVSQVNKAQQDMRQSQKAYQTQQKREGDIDVNYVPKKMKKNQKILEVGSMWTMRK